MRKYIIGFVAGLLIASVAPAYGAVSSLIGKKVGSEITVNLNNNEVGSAIIVDGRSYLPVRATADALKLGLEVTKEAINLVSDTPAMLENDNFDQIQFLNGSIDGLKGLKNIATVKRDQLQKYLDEPDGRLEKAQSQLASYTDKTVPEYQRQQERVDYFEQVIVDTKNEIAALDTKIADYDRQIADLEAQKATLESK